MIDDKVSGGICDAVFEFNLFDAALDEDTQVDISQTKKLLLDSNAMLAV